VNEFESCLALRHCRGLGPRTWKRLLETYGTARAAVADWPSWSGRGLVTPKVQAEFGQEGWRDRAWAERNEALSLGLSVLTHGDPAYPDLLREIPDPPLFLYYLGDLSLLMRPSVAVVGSRQSSRYGTGMAESLAQTLSRAGVCVVSGFAHGIDRAADDPVEAEGIRFEGVDAALRVPGTDLRLFGKPVSFTRRRMGVAVAEGRDIEEARSRAREAASRVKPVGDSAA